MVDGIVDCCLGADSWNMAHKSYVRPSKDIFVYCGRGWLMVVRFALYVTSRIPDHKNIPGIHSISSFSLPVCALLDKALF